MPKYIRTFVNGIRGKSEKVEWDIYLCRFVSLQNKMCYQMISHVWCKETQIWKHIRLYLIDEWVLSECVLYSSCTLLLTVLNLTLQSSQICETYLRESFTTWVSNLSPYKTTKIACVYLSIKTSSMKRTRESHNLRHSNYKTEHFKFKVDILNVNNETMF